MLLRVPPMTHYEATTVKKLFRSVGSSLAVGLLVGLSACTAAPTPTAPTVAAVATAASPAAATAVAVASPAAATVAVAVSPAATVPTTAGPHPASPTQVAAALSRVTGTGTDGLSLRAEPRISSEQLKI